MESALRITFGRLEAGMAISVFRNDQMYIACAALSAALLCGTAFAQDATQPEAADLRQELPPAPKGKATVIGGKIGQLDPVRDQFNLEIYGSKPLKLLYDARTELYRNGARAPLSSLRSGERASVETTLDGTAVFALKLHILSDAPKGDCSGQVQAWDEARGILAVFCRDSSARVSFRIRPTTQVSSSGAVPSGSGLSKGDLVRVAFEPDGNGRGIATRILLLAKPGSYFVLHGELVSLDIPAGHLTIADARDNMSYAVAFDPGALPGPAELQEGARVQVKARFDGTGYTATSIEPE